MQNLGGNLTIITEQKRILLNCHYAIITPSVINIISRVIRESCTGTIIITQGKQSPTPAAASLPLQKEKRLWPSILAMRHISISSLEAD